MKRIASLLIVGALSALSPISVAWAADTVTPIVNPPITANVPAPPATASAPSASPAVRAAVDAQQPGKVRPESAVVPQISIPLRSTTSSAGALTPPGPPNSQRDDRAAACAAHITKEDRQKCERSL